MYKKLALPDFIHVGSRLPWDVFNDQGILLLSGGTVVNSSHQFEGLIELGAYVGERAYEAHKRRESGLGEEPGLFDLWDDLYRHLDTMLLNPDRNPRLVDELTRIAADIQSLAERDEDIAIFAVNRLDQGNFAVTHALHVAVTGEIYGRFLRWEAVDRVTLVKAALAMNIALLDVQNHLSRHAGPPTPEQQEQIRRHPVDASEHLRTLGVEDESWLRTVAEHHETRDGKGYPLGLTEVFPAAEVLHLIDRYCSLMTHHRRSPAISTNQLARQLYLVPSTSPKEVVAQMISAFGLFTPGNFVRLANGETSIVLRRGARAHKPLVATIVTPGDVQLSDPIHRNTDDEGFAVTALVPDRDVRVEVDPIKVFGLRQER